MRRRGRGSREGVLIDLTSLLDVIFILLLVVTCGVISEQKTVADTQAESQAALAAAEQEAQAYHDMQETQTDLQKFVYVASIVVPYEKEEITRRQIKLLVEDQEMITVELVGSDVTEGLETFRSALTEYAEAHSDHPVILSLNEDDEQILYRDEIAVQEILQSLLEKHTNVYLKGNLRED